jgi:hypothetical protein
MIFERTVTFRAAFDRRCCLRETDMSLRRTTCQRCGRFNGIDHVCPTFSSELSEKLCRNCERTQPIDRFSKLKSGLRASYCRDCHVKSAGTSVRRRREVVAQYGRRWRLHAKYSIAPNDYERLLAIQKGVCAICHQGQKGRWKPLNVDHDHRTGRVRGLLCTRCNLWLAWFEKHSAAIERYIREGDAGVWAALGGGIPVAV